MFKRLIIILPALLLTVVVYGQSNVRVKYGEGMTDSLRLSTPDSLLISLPDSLLLTLPDLPAGIFDNPANLANRAVMPFDVSPFGTGVAMPTMNIANPLAGYSRPSNTYYWSRNAVVAPARYRYLYSDDVGVSGGVRLNDKITLNSNVFMSTGRTYPYKRWWGGTANASLSYQISDRLSANVYGQYSTMPLNNSYMSTSMYGTNFGASLDYRAAEWLSLVGGVDRSLYMGKWQTNYYVTPVLHIGNVSIPLPVFNFSPERRERSTAPNNLPAAPAPRSGTPERFGGMKVKR